MDFWIKLDQMLASHKIIIDRPKSSHHPEHPDLVYPFDYGYLKGTSTGDGKEIDVCRGTPGESRLAAVICTVDTRKQDTEVKLLIDCTDDEINVIDRFYNTNKYMSGIIIKRPV